MIERRKNLLVASLPLRVNANGAIT